MRLHEKGQSMLEYAILIAVVIAALIIMQMIVKRGYQGNLKDASGRMGDQYSVSSTTVKSVRTMKNPQIITEEQATTAPVASSYLPAGYQAYGGTKGTLVQTLDQAALSTTERRGGSQEIATGSLTEAAKDEKTRLKDLQSNDVTSYTQADIETVVNQGS